jgi:hypothetical protein
MKAKESKENKSQTTEWMKKPNNEQINEWYDEWQAQVNK